MSRRRRTSRFAAPLLATALAAAAVATAAAPPSEEELSEAVSLTGGALADMEEGNWGRAEERLLRVAELLPDNLLPPVNLAISYERMGRLADARAQIERALAIDPDNRQALYLSARLLLPRVADDPAVARIWEEIVAKLEAVDPGDPRPHHLRFLRWSRAGDRRRALEALAPALRRSPDNLLLLVERLVLAAGLGDAEGAGDALDAVEDRLNGFGRELEGIAERLRFAVYEGRSDGLGPPAQIVRNLLRPTDLYQVGRIELEGAGLGDGFFPQLEFDPPLPARVQGGEDIDFELVDLGAAVFAGGAARDAVAIELERRGEDAVLALERVAGSDRLQLRRDGDAGTAATVAAGAPLSCDLDQDGRTDLVVAAPGRGVFVHRGLEGGGYDGGRSIAALPGDAAVAVLAPLELDHDGDLDLFVGRDGAADLYLRNNGGGPWSEHAAELGIDGGGAATRALASADFDEDGDLDLVLVYADRPPRYFRNHRAGRLAEATEAEGLADVGPADGVAVADVDGDGRFDLFFWGGLGSTPGVRPRLRAGGRFADPGAPAEVSELAVAAAAAGDFDNDGDADLVLAPAAGGLTLLRNRGGRLAAEAVGGGEAQVSALEVGDFDADGDLDLMALTAAGEVRSVVNRGGERNQWLRLALVGRNRDSGKNNVQGWYTRIELRSGGRYQATLGNGGINHLGLGARRQAEVMRVVWTNGVAQTWQRVGARQTLVEEQLLKGSCPFLYTWTGERFEFHTDLMWRSTLGMRFADGSPAPHLSARDWVLIPGERLRPAAGQLWLQVTAELWETIYVDRQRLEVVDTPPGYRPVVDESFRPPPFPRRAPLHWVGAPRPPIAAVDGRGRDRLPALLARDGVYVDDLPIGRYQGVAAEHRLELAFDRPPPGQRLRLLMTGWIFPADTSINTALAADPTVDAAPPRLEMKGGDGVWRPVPGGLGLPNGKRKTVVVELGRALAAGASAPLELRLTSTMQIYWDAAALAVGEERPGARITRLEPAAADLHYRGFSRLVRESPSGPHLFDYAAVSVAPRFPWMPGRHTRYGAVGELLGGEDDRYVVLAAGDEMTVRYDASALPELPAGWRRDYVLYTDGWVKDADLNTAGSASVEPWPYHGMTAYPPPAAAGSSAAAGAEHLRLYQTRWLDRAPFHDALRRGAQTLRRDDP